MRYEYGKNQNQGLKGYLSELFGKIRELLWFRILIVEDSLESQQILKMAMDTLPCSVDAAQDGEEGIELLLHNDYDLVIVDQDLPDTHGLRVLEAVDQVRGQEAQGQKPTPVIVYSALDFKPVEGLKAFRFADFIKKPTPIRKIHERVVSILRAKGSQMGVGQNL